MHLKNACKRLIWSRYEFLKSAFGSESDLNIICAPPIFNTPYQVPISHLSRISDHPIQFVFLLLFFSSLVIPCSNCNPNFVPGLFEKCFEQGSGEPHSPTTHNCGENKHNRPKYGAVSFTKSTATKRTFQIFSSSPNPRPKPLILRIPPNNLAPVACLLERCMPHIAA